MVALSENKNYPAPYLKRLSARNLPKLKALWQGLLWRQAQAVLFKYLTHADFSGCSALYQIKLNAPQLRYLTASGCDHPNEITTPTPEWMLDTPQLKYLDVSQCPRLVKVEFANTPALGFLNKEGSDQLSFSDLLILLNTWLEIDKEADLPQPNSSGLILKALSREDEQKCEVKESAVAELPGVDPAALYEQERDKKVQRQVFVSKLLAQFLKYVVEGEQNNAEAMLQANPNLLLMPGTVTDLSKRTFTNITAFQYALWALDWHMWKMLLRYMPPEAAAMQFQELEDKGLGVHGKHFNLTPLIEVLNTYMSNYDAWVKADKWTAMKAQWRQQVGGAQLLLPAHVVNEYCRPDRSFSPCPAFTEETLPRTRNLYYGSKGEWFTAVENGGTLGITFGVIRAGLPGAGALFAAGGVEWRGGVVRVQYMEVDRADRDALQSLLKTRQQQLLGLKQELGGKSNLGMDKGK